MDRRSVIYLGLLMPICSEVSANRAIDGVLALQNIPIELVGNWRDSLPNDISVVVNRMRIACLTGIKLRSDRTPNRLRIDDHTNGPPHIWLHKEDPAVAWIVVDVGTRDWCKLAYQFGHELGHVVANSWTADAIPGGACQWLEEALVEAFSLYGLGRLALSWRKQPPFPNDQAYANAILDYRARTLLPDEDLAQAQQVKLDVSSWVRKNQKALESSGTMEGSRPLVPSVLSIYESNPTLIEDLCALNRWPERTYMSIDRYFDNWTRSCIELGTSGELSKKLGALILR